jgi:hypothetical protein
LADTRAPMVENPLTLVKTRSGPHWAGAGAGQEDTACRITCQILRSSY